MGRLLRWLWLALCVLSCRWGYGMVALPSDTLYVSGYGERLVLRPFLEKQFHTLRYHSLVTGREVVLHANTPVGLGMGVGWRWAGISLSVGLPGTGQRRDAPTRSFDFQYHYHGSHLVGDLYVQWYKGYYHEQLDGTLVFDARLTFRRLGLRLAYPLLGERVSYAALFNQAAVQRRFALCYPVGLGVYWQDAQRMAGRGRLLRGGHIVGEFYAGMCAAIPLGRGVYTAVEVTLGLSGPLGRHVRVASDLRLAAMGRTVIGYSTSQWSLALVGYAHSMGGTTRYLPNLRILSGSSELAFSWRLFSSGGMGEAR